MKPKRRNLTRWQANRLRRLEHKLSWIDRARALGTRPYPWNDASPESETHCRERANELTKAVQAAKFRTASDALMVGFADTYSKLAQ